MGNVYILLARGFEESEAIVPADILKRAGANVYLVSVEGSKTVTGSHGFTIETDMTMDGIKKDEAECIVLPGGGLGTEILGKNSRVLSLIEFAVSRGIFVGAICAAPSILGKMRLLDGRNAAVYPSFEDSLKYANITGKKVEHDDIFITAEGMGVSFEFGFELVKLLFGLEKVEELKNTVRFDG